MNNEINHYQGIINHLIDAFTGDEKDILKNETYYESYTDPLPLETLNGKNTFTTGDDYVLRLMPTSIRAINFLAKERDRIHEVLQELCKDTHIKWMLVSVKNGGLVVANFTHLPTGDKKDFAITLFEPRGNSLIEVVRS